MATLILPRGLLHGVVAHARAVYPNEACGFLLGEHGVVRFAAPVENTHPDPAHHFQITPDRVEYVVERAEQLGTGIIGGYHSHPNGNLTPSQADLRSSPGPDYIHLIITPEGEARAWTITECPYTPIRVPIAWNP